MSHTLVGLVEEQRSVGSSPFHGLCVYSIAVSPVTLVAFDLVPDNAREIRKLAILALRRELVDCERCWDCGDGDVEARLEQQSDR